jgi:hypothetical protein
LQSFLEFLCNTIESHNSCSFLVVIMFVDRHMNGNARIAKTCADFLVIGKTP